MDNLTRLITFLEKLEESNIYFKLNKIRDSILVEIAVPGARWEVEFMQEGTVEVEKFTGSGEMFDESELNNLFKEYSD